MPIFLVFLFACAAVLCNGAPQFLPVAVQFDPTVVRRATRSTTSTTTPLPITTIRGDIDTTVSELIRKEESDVLQTTEVAQKNADNEILPNTLLLSEENRLNRKKESTLKKIKKRKPKDSKRITIGQNSFFQLKTINDQPAHEVLKNDEASQPRSAEQVAESRLVHVRKLKIDQE